MSEENEKRKMKYIDKIISLISPVLIGLNHYQISLLLDEVTKRILNETVFTGVQENNNHPISDQGIAQKEDVAN